MTHSKKDLDAQIEESIQFIRSKTSAQPKSAIILGSGLGSFADTLEDLIKIPTKEIPHFPVSTVQGHSGNLVFGQLSGKSVLALQGRTHYYEGHDISRVAYVVRLMAELGVRNLLVTNASGGVNSRFKPGDLMVIDDQINMMFRNPLRGPVVKGETRWPDMNHAYDPEISDLIEKIGLEQGIALKRGVLYVSTGPTYETAAEVRMIQKLGGDAASMSTVPEVIVARARGIRVGGISCITNHATGISPTPLSHEEVTEIANQVKEKFQKLIKEVLIQIS